MTPVSIVEGRAYPLAHDNVDTDVIIAARHLKTLSRAGLGRHAFETLRQSPGNIFDDPLYAGAPILIAGANFGCGSSREHAAWALSDLGVVAVIARSFSDIFAANAYKNGIAAIELPDEAIGHLLACAEDKIRVDLESQVVTVADGRTFPFTMDPFRRQALLDGSDEISLTLEHEAAIARHEAGNRLYDL